MRPYFPLRELQEEKRRGPVSQWSVFRLRLRASPNSPRARLAASSPSVCNIFLPISTRRSSNDVPLCSRLLAEDAVKLSKTIAELTNRCRQLEDALRTLQAKYSNESHPLLDSTLLTPEQLVSPVNDHSHQDDGPDELDAIQDSLGTLTISDGKAANFLGRTAGMHVRFLSLPFPPTFLILFHTDVTPGEFLSFAFLGNVSKTRTSQMIRG